MSEQAIRDEIIDPMQRLFIPPKNMEGDQQALALREYMDALRGFEREDLRAAWHTIRDSAVARSWPPIGAFLKAALLAKRERQTKMEETNQGRTAPLHRFDMDGWRAHFFENWKHIKHTPLAQAAAKEGWALMLKTAVFDGLPLAEIRPAQMVAKVERAAKLAGIIEADLEYPERAKVLDMWRNVLITRAEVEIEISNARGTPPPMPLVPAFVYPCKVHCLIDPPAHRMDRVYGQQEMLA